MGKAVGIDLGTSTSCVACVIDGKPQAIPGPDGRSIQASVVSFLPDGSRVVGNAAKKMMVENAENTVYSAKRLIGRKFFSAEVKKAQAVSSYKIVEGPNQSDSFQGSFTLDGPASPGDYMLIVVQGPAQVKVSGAVNAGDLLGSAGLAGYAARATEVKMDGVLTAVPGTVFGKALESVDGGEKTIYVFVTLQ